MPVTSHTSVHLARGQNGGEGGGCPSLQAKAKAHGWAGRVLQEGLRLLNGSRGTVRSVPGPGTAEPVGPFHFIPWEAEA